MTFYRIEIQSSGESLGYSYHPSRRSAEMAAKRAKQGGAEIGPLGIERHQFRSTKAELLKWANKWASHPNNG